MAVASAALEKCADVLTDLRHAAMNHTGAAGAVAGGLGGAGLGALTGYLTGNSALTGAGIGGALGAGAGYLAGDKYQDPIMHALRTQQEQQGAVDAAQGHADITASLLQQAENERKALRAKVLADAHAHGGLPRYNDLTRFNGYLKRDGLGAFSNFRDDLARDAEYDKYRSSPYFREVLSPTMNRPDRVDDAGTRQQYQQMIDNILRANKEYQAAVKLRDERRQNQLSAGKELKHEQSFLPKQPS